MKRRALLLLLMVMSLMPACAQIGNYRQDLAIGFNGGYALTNFRFTPKVNQGLHGGMTGGLTVRYTCEKYFNTICAILGEVNFAQMGWKESILT